MHGWRARIGLMIPSTNTVMEMEFHNMLPEGVSVHTSRMYMPKVERKEDKEKAELAMNQDMKRAAKVLKTANTHVIVYGCSTGSMHGGESYDRGILEQITKQTGIPSVSVASSVIQALKVLRVKKVAVTTPYAEELNQVEKRFLESVGFEITDIEGLDIIDAFEIGHLRPEDAYIRGSKIDSPEADGIFISCTNWQSIEVIDMLERDLGKPVITSNQSTFWAALRKAGIHQPIEGFGSLLKEYP